MDYKIQATRKGDYIIRNGSREVARIATQVEAQAWIDQREISDAASAAERQSRIADQEKFNASVPEELNVCQIQWQQWRDWFYGEMVAKDRRHAAAERAMARMLAPGTATFQRHIASLARNSEILEDLKTLYEEIVTLDGQIKAARREQNADALAKALSDVMPMVARMKAALPHVGGRPPEEKPEEKPKKSVGGTAPDTSLHLGAERRSWLREQGGIQPTIHSLIDGAREPRIYVIPTDRVGDEPLWRQWIARHGDRIVKTLAATGEIDDLLDLGVDQDTLEDAMHDRAEMRYGTPAYRVGKSGMQQHYWITNTLSGRRDFSRRLQEAGYD